MSERQSGGAAPLSDRVLDEIRAVGGDELLRDVLASFLERTPERLRAAAAAAECGDLTAAGRALHSLRSAAGAVGAVGLAELAGELERLAVAGAAGELGAGLEQLARRTEEALAAARRWVSASTAP